jgi:hypothetical protein
MKLLSLSIVALLSSCATAPPAISARQEEAFHDVVRSAEAAGAGENPPTAASRLRDAKSDFYYAEHSPMNPARARRLVATAQAEAESARDLAQSYSLHQIELRTSDGSE